MLLPTPASLAFAAAWNASAPEMIEQGLSEQDGLPLLETDSFVSCSSLCACFDAARNVSPGCRGQLRSVQHSSHVTHCTTDVLFIHCATDMLSCCPPCS